jgi:type III secretion system (T3SS) SseB-like protein
MSEPTVGGPVRVNTDTEFEPFNDLERKLLKAATGGPRDGAAFESAMLIETLYAATPRPLAEGALGAGDKVDLLQPTLPDGTRATALFTSLERLAATFPEGGYVGAPGRAMLGLVGAAAVVVNPGHPHAIAWYPDAVQTLLRRPKLELR